MSKRSGTGEARGCPVRSRHELRFISYFSPSVLLSIGRWRGKSDCTRGGVILTKLQMAWVQLLQSERVRKKAGQWTAPIFQHWQSLLAWKMPNLPRLPFWQTHYKTHTSTSCVYVKVVSSVERRNSAEEWSELWHRLEKWISKAETDTNFYTRTLRSLSSIISSDSWVSNTTRRVDATMRTRPQGHHHV